ncbi:MAG TPA: hypothetical protein VFI11_14480 [Anaerolineales bacterium]|nr:hypothetical protein [Anaerolineales bacterium]
MDIQRRPLLGRLVTLAVVASILIFAIVIGSLLLHPRLYALFGSVLGPALEGAVVRGGLFLAAPLGVFSLVIGGLVLTLRQTSRLKAWAVLSAGLAGVLTGAYWWLLMSSI